MGYDNYWTVQKSVRGRWTDDDDGPHVLYRDREEALAWARKLLLIYPRVRLSHVVTTHEEVRT